MIFTEPVFRPGGDRFIEMELGDEMSFDLNFRVHSVSKLIRESGPAGIIEIVPELTSIMISYDFERISYADVVTEVTALFHAVGPLDGLELDSRMFYLPIRYFDPWTRECYDDYCAKIAPKERDPELVARLNGLADLAQLARVHSGTDYWVAALGFYPGLVSLMPLDPRCRLTAPKYDPPRTWTHKGTIGIGGALCSIYPDRTPGGYQMIARTPVPIWDPAQRLAAFAESLALFRPAIACASSRRAPRSTTMSRPRWRPAPTSTTWPSISVSRSATTTSGSAPSMRRCDSNVLLPTFQ